MPEVSDLAEAPPAPLLPQPLLPVPTGLAADVPPPVAVRASPDSAGASRPSLPTLGKPATAVPEAGATSEASEMLAAAAASASPHAMAAAAHFAAVKQAAAMPSVKSLRPPKKQKRKARRVVVPVLMLAVLGGTGYTGRDSTLMARLRGENYDTSMLPLTAYPRITAAGLETTNTGYSVSVQGDAITVDEHVVDSIGNPATGDKQLERRTVTRNVVDGEPQNPPVSEVKVQTLRVGPTQYNSPLTDSEPWQQTPTQWQQTGPQVAEVWMYQDLVDRRLRTITPDSVVEETLNAVEVTTYRWDIPFGEMREAAPFAFGRFGVLSGNADPDSSVSLTISVDADGIVWVVDVELELASVIDRATEAGDGLDYFYRFRFELDSLVESAPTIIAPAAVEPLAPTPEGGA